jgi:hypothetical protein
VGYYLELMNRSNMLPYLLGVAGAILTLRLQTMKAIIASQVLNWLTFVPQAGLVFFQLVGSPKAIAAQELDRCTKRITRESVWLGSQVPLLATASRDDTGIADIAHDHLMNRVMRKHDGTMPRATYERLGGGLLKTILSPTTLSTERALVSGARANREPRIPHRRRHFALT